MVQDNIITFFAPAARASDEEIKRQRATLLRQPLLREILDAMSDGVMILNPQRQLLLANKRLLETLGLTEDGSLVGFRPGEALDCVHARECPGGCGTSEACQTCGAARAIMDSQEEGESRHECRITRGAPGQELSLEFNVLSTVINVEGGTYLVFALDDISHEKRRRVLERIFFHDILNTAGGLKGFADMLKEEATGELASLAGMVIEASDRLISEIQAQRYLAAAENNELEIAPTRLNSKMFLEDVIRRFRWLEAAKDKHLVLDPTGDNVAFISDPTLLGRVVGNLIKNALEASSSGEDILLSCTAPPETIEFSVHNRAIMPREVQLQMFQRSFSTKGAGRGLGAYSVKLLSERYLRGTVSFTSTPEEGTAFRVRFPRQLTRF
ncbi:MAG: PAS domain-containing sensor histidine kinase [Thermodesulfobacteriota bacterium]